MRNKILKLNRFETMKILEKTHFILCTQNFNTNWQHSSINQKILFPVYAGDEPGSV